MSTDANRLIVGWLTKTLADGLGQFGGAVENSLGPWGGVVLIICGFFILAMCAGIIIYLYRHTCCCRRVSAHDAVEKGSPASGATSAKAMARHLKKSPLQASFYKVDGDPLPSDITLPLGDVSYWSWARGSMYDAASLEGDVEDTFARGARGASSVRDSTYSSMSDSSSLTTISSGRDSHNGDATHPPAVAALGNGAPPPATPKPMLALRLQYGLEVNQLTVTARGVRSLPNRDYGSSPSPQCHVILERTRWPHMIRSAQLVNQLSTPVARRTRNPNWEHTFTLNVTPRELKDWQARFDVWDDCKLQGSRVVGEVMLVFKRHMDHLLTGAPTNLQLPLAPTEQQRGFLLFGLSYLPTSQRLSVTVVQGVRLRWQLVAPTLQDFRPHIRATLVSPAYGKVICRSRLEAKQGAENVEFSGTMMLDLTTHELSTASLVIAVCFKPATQSATQSVAQSAAAERAKSRILGSVSVGTQVATSRGREHWWAVAHCPRRVVSIWHALR